MKTILQPWPPPRGCEKKQLCSLAKLLEPWSRNPQARDLHPLFRLTPLTPAGLEPLLSIRAAVVECAQQRWVWAETAASVAYTPIHWTPAPALRGVIPFHTLGN